MPARTGQEYLQGLRERRREIWMCGERIEDVTRHPAFRNGARSVAALYDMQHNPALRQAMTYVSPTSGERVGLSFITPQTLQDLERRRLMMTHWAQASCGMMARTPDFLNVAFMAMAAAGDYFGGNRPAFKTNIQRYYEFLREGDITLTHTLVNPQRTRSPSLTDPLQEEVALTVVRETDAGVVVRGCRILATLGPLSDEIAVYPARTHLTTEDASRLSFAFAIPCDTPGLKFLCRESFDMGRSTFDHPLGSRFEEMDAVVFFGDVMVPWERAKLFHLAWDVACSAFGGRQVLYERFFGGDPVRNAMILYNFYDCKPLMDRVLDFLQQDD
jgi:4-hydroxyphenylacetate 3-monooxygenase